MKVTVHTQADIESGKVSADALVSIRGVGVPATPSIDEQCFGSRILLLYFDDVPVPNCQRHGLSLVGPTRAQVEDALTFGRDVRRSGVLHLAVHCLAGQSRSTAIALGILADQLGAGHEAEAVSMMMADDLRDERRPNPLAVRFADEILERGGRLEATLWEKCPNFRSWSKYWALNAGWRLPGNAPTLPGLDRQRRQPTTPNDSGREINSVPFLPGRQDLLAYQVKYSDIAFLDIEASGLGDQSFPVEIGFVFAADFSGWSTLIRPRSTWQGKKSWESKAESLHGLSLDRLLLEGMDVADVARALNSALAYKEVFSDAPDFDRHWLSMLFTAAWDQPKFELRDGAALLRDARFMVELDVPILLMPPQIMLRKHRAKDDACALAIQLRTLLS